MFHPILSEEILNSGKIPLVMALKIGKKHHCRFAHIELNAAFRSKWTEEVAAIALCGLKLPPPAP